MKKLCKKIFEDEDIRDIPVEYVIRIVSVIFELINSGEFYYQND